MSYRNIFLLIAAVVLLLLLLPGIRIWKVTSSDIESRIKNELPIGSDQYSVIYFLDKYKFEHSGYLFKEKSIQSIQRDSCYGVLIECSIEVSFMFDDQQKLASYTINEGFTAP